MPSNPNQDSQQTGETTEKSLFSKIASNLNAIISGVFIAAVGGIIVNYVIQENFLKRYESYENSNYGIKLEHPKKWSIQEKVDSLHPEVNFISPQETDADNFQEKVTVAIENLSQPLSIKEYAAKATAQIELANTIIESAEKINFANKEGREIIYQEKDGNKKRREVWMIKNQKVYIATYTAEEEKFDKFAKQADKIIKSVNIK